MLNSDNYENGKKSIDPMNQKTALHVQHTFLNISTYTFYVLFISTYTFYRKCMFSMQKKKWSPLLFISRFSSFSVIHANVDISI